jgi:transposase InsO family protein
VKFAFIDVEKALWPVAVQCDVFGVSSSGYYAWKRRPEAPRATEDAELVVEVKAAHKTGRGAYGSPRVHRELRAKGRRVGRKRVERLMRQEGICGRKKRRFRKTTDSNHPDPIAPNVLERNFNVDLPDTAWVGADETRLRLIRDKTGKTRNGFVWTFGARDDEGGLDVAYVFTEDRSGSTPKNLLEGTTGVLLVDGYSGYNVVEAVSTRKRAACHAHLRRYFHEALPTAPVAQEMLDLVAELYRAEHAGDAQGLNGVSKLDFRKERAGPIRTRMKGWLDAQRDRHPPKSPIAAAIRYADNQWEELGVFLDDSRVPLDNNGSERALRRVALGRNYAELSIMGRSLAIRREFRVSVLKRAA